MQCICGFNGGAGIGAPKIWNLADDVATGGIKDRHLRLANPCTVDITLIFSVVLARVYSIYHTLFRSPLISGRRLDLGEGQF